jgi:hypothetical protein
MEIEASKLEKDIEDDFGDGKFSMVSRLKSYNIIERTTFVNVFVSVPKMPLGPHGKAGHIPCC